MIFGLITMAVANAALALGALDVADRVRTGRAEVDVLTGLLVRLLLISTTVLLSGLGGVLSPGVLGGAGAALLFFLIARGTHRKLRQWQVPELGFGIAIMAALILARLISQVWFFSPFVGDVLSYHLPKVAEWVRGAGFSRELGLDSHASLPAGFELVETWWVVFLHHDVLIEMAGVEFLAVGSVGMYAFAKGCGLASRTALLSALLFVLVPGIHLQATASMNDAPVAVLVVCTAAMLLHSAPWLLIVLPLGLGIGVKATFGYAIPGLVLLAWMSRKEQRLPIPSFRAAWGIVGFALLVGSFWYLRNMVWFGNPIHPITTHGLLAQDGKTRIQFGPRLSSLFINLSSLVTKRLWNVTGPYSVLLTNMSGWGPVAWACGLPALFLSLRKPGPMRRAAAGFGLSLLCVLALVNTDPWCMRFVLFFPALLSASAAAVAERFKAVRWIAWAGILLQFATTMVPAELSLEGLRFLAGIPWRERAVQGPSDVRIEGDVVGCFGGDHMDADLIYGADYSRRVVYLRSGSAEALIREIDLAGLRLLVAKPDSHSQSEILEECLRRNSLRAAGRFVYLRERSN